MQNKQIKISGVISSLGTIAIFISCLLLPPSFVDANSVVDHVSIKVPIACSMHQYSESSTPHTASIENGIYRENIGTTTIKAFCNDIEDFSIYAVGFTDEEYGKNVLSSSTFGQAQDIITGTAKNGDSSNWAMKLSIDSPANYGIDVVNNYDDYNVVPSNYIKVATRESGTDVGLLAEGSTFTTTYAAYISKKQLPDTYIGKVKYSLIHPHNDAPAQAIDTDANYIAYYPNTNIYSGTMGRQSVSSADTSKTLLASNFSRPGYGFAGWNTKHDYSGTYYGPNETIEFLSGQFTEKGLSLYAVWIKSQGLLQEWRSCSSLDIGETTALTDIRDDQVYAIAKLTEGKCWMIENLRLENHGTDNQNGSFAQGYASSFAGLANPESANFLQSNTANSIYSIDNSASGPIITGANTGYRFPRYNNINTANRATTPTDNNGNIYEFGNYYTWAAAIADTSYYEDSTIDATSICPAGWHLPTGQVGGEFYNLNYATNGNIDTTSYTFNDIIRKYPNNFVYSGYFDNSSALNRGNNAGYWSSTTGSVNGSYYLYMLDSRVYPGTTGFYKYTGQSIRCISNN